MACRGRVTRGERAESREEDESAIGERHEASEWQRRPVNGRRATVNSAKKMEPDIQVSTSKWVNGTMGCFLRLPPLISGANDVDRPPGFT
ncbi:MAG: hypothetical protein ACREDR_48935, partial [Blastocatellia bacterium]